MKRIIKKCRNSDAKAWLNCEYKDYVYVTAKNKAVRTCAYNGGCVKTGGKK